MFGQKSFVSKLIFGPEKSFGPKKIGSKKNLGSKKFWVPKNFGWKKMFGTKKIVLKERGGSYLKGPYHLEKKIHMKDINFLNTINRFQNSSWPLSRLN